MEKIAFIICYNNELYMKECLQYISWLKVPEGMEKEIIGITDAESMAAGYNAAMHESDAKYKVYLHQDLYILNENFIEDVIDLFLKYPEYGMLGVIGSQYMISDANYWKAWEVGKCDAYNGLAQVHVDLENNAEISEVKAIDGMIMITQYDVEWREDIFDGFDFYDVSQSEEFRKYGYKVGVPYQEISWCNHVCGTSKLKRYDEYRMKFCNEYQKYGYDYKANQEINEKRNGNSEIEKILPQIEWLYNNKKLSEMNEAVREAANICQYNTRLCELRIINQVIQMEITENIQNGFYNEKLSCDEIIEKYQAFHFLMLRLEYGKNEKGMQDILKEVMDCDLKSVIQIAEYTVFDVSTVAKKLAGLALQKEMIKNGKIRRYILENSIQSKGETEIAYCIPTYNHSDIIQEVLQAVGYLYKQNNIDIYIYDSSDNYKTYWIAKHFAEQGMDNLYYVKIDSSIGFDEKLMMIFQGYELQHKYKYLWVVKDRVCVYNATLQTVLQETHKDYDAIFLDVAVDTTKPDIKPVYYDAGEFYKQAGWIASSMNTTLYHYDKLLKNIDWKEFKEKYFFDGENEFDHFCVLFHALGKKENIKVRYLTGDNIQFAESHLGKSLWMKRAFKTWGKLWIKVNEALPDCYAQYKKDVIKKTTSQPWILGSVDILLFLREKAVLTPEVYNQFKDRWTELSYVPVDDFKNIAYGEIQELKATCKTFWNRLSTLFVEEKYQDICVLYYVYGWMRQLDEDGRYIMLGECVKIYLLEMQKNIEQHIFYQTTGIDEVLEKYIVLKFLLNRIEYGIDIEEWGNLSEYVRRNHISSQFILYMASRHCQNPDFVIEKFLNLVG